MRLQEWIAPITVQLRLPGELGASSFQGLPALCLDSLPVWLEISAGHQASVVEP